MLTTEKWSAPASSVGACSPDRRPDRNPGGVLRPRLVWWCLLALPALLFTGCEPPGPAALRKGHHLIAAARPSDAIEPLKRAIRLLGTNDLAVAQAWNHLGLAHHYARQFPEALAAYQAALGKDFNLFAARYNRGVLLLELNNLPAAINELTTYTAHEPRHPDAWLKLGLAQLRARLYDPADRSFQQVLALNAPPALHAEALNNLGVSNAQRRRTREAFQYLNAALKAQTNYAPAILNQAIVAQQQLGDRRLALGRYRAYLDTARTTPDRGDVEALAISLDAALNPPVAAATPAPQPTNPPAAVVALSNLTSLLTRTTAVANVPSPVAPPTLAVETSPPPALVAVKPPAERTNPPAPIVTQTPSVVTQAPPIVARVEPTAESVATETNLPAPTEPVPTIVRSRTPPPGVVSESKPEVVIVEPEPEVKVARDVAPSVAVVRPGASTNAVVTPLVRPIGSDREAQEKEKKSIVGRLNPLGWFGGSDEEDARKAEAKAREKAEKEAAREARKREKERGPTTPLPKPAGEVKPLPSVASAATAAPPVATAASFTRYKYVAPVVAQTGDLAAAQTPFQEGVRMHQANRLKDAIASYRKAVALAPGFYDAWYNLGVAAALTGDNATALDAYEQALALKPAEVNARFNLALALNAAGYPLDAMDELETVLNASPGFAEAHLTLGGIYADQMKDTAKARSHYQKFLELSPRHPSAVEVRRWLAANR